MTKKVRRINQGSKPEKIVNEKYNPHNGSEGVEMHKATIRITERQLRQLQGLDKPMAESVREAIGAYLKTRAKVALATVTWGLVTRTIWTTEGVLAEIRETVEESRIKGIKMIREQFGLSLHHANHIAKNIRALPVELRS